MMRHLYFCAISGILALGLFSPAPALAQPDPAWEIHDMERPRPAVVTPGEPATQERAGTPPSDAIVLFDGTSTTGDAEWQGTDGSSFGWRVENGYMEVARRAGPITSKRGFGDAQIHVEWAQPNPPRSEGQDRGNSGIFLMEQYEIQVLDSYDNDTYPDGQAASVYGQYPPLVNAMNPPGKWQTYDIIFHRPRFDSAGALLSPARVTLFHNGVLVQDNVSLTGPSGHHARPPYAAHPDRLPISLQDHGSPVRYRSIWVRDLED